LLIGGIEEFKSTLVENEIRFALLEVLVTGDDYNAVKFVLVTYIGNQVPAGIAKAKAAGHRQELLDFIKQTVAVASEYQCSTIEEVNTKEISASLTKVRERYQDSISVGQVKDERQTKSRSHGNAGDKTKSRLIIENEDFIRNELLKLHSTDEIDWCVFFSFFHSFCAKSIK
jgi:hypothetical protein